MPLIRPGFSVSKKALFKRAALIYLPVIVLLSIVILLSIRQDGQGRIERAEMRENSRVQIALERVAQDFSEADSDLHVIASLTSLRHYLDSGNPAWRDELARVFVVLSKEKRHYDQVRLLNASGMEIIRVNYNDGQPAIAPREQLQNKSDRYYFRESIKLGQGKTYVSPLDLNIEQGQLEIPYKPIIRFGMPVFDRAGRKQGAIVLNYLGGKLLRDFRGAMQGSDLRNGMLLNREGYWLSSRKADDEWGFMLSRNERTFGHDFPEQWRTISSSDAGTLLTAQGLFVYDTVYPLLTGKRASISSSMPRTSGQQESNGREYYWKIVSFVPHEVLTGAALYNQTGGRIILAMVYLLLALAAWIIALVTLYRKQARAELAASKARYDELVRSIPVGVYLFRFHTDGSMGFEYVSPVFCQILGLDEDVVLRDAGTAFAAAHPEDRDSLIRLNREAVTSLQPFFWEGRFIVRGETRWILIESDSAPQDGDGSLWSGVVSDITERKRIEEALRRSSEEIEDLYDHAPCGYHSLDEHGMIVRMNHTELEWLGYSREEVVSKMHFPDLLTPDSQQTFRESFPRFLKLGYEYDLEFELKRKDGSVLPILLGATAVRDADGRLTMSRSTLFDLTERKKLERELERQARIDMLTGLNNRRHFFELAEHELARARRHDQPLAVLMLDVDHFKRVNDTYGHHVGDMVLRKMSEVCIQTLRENDILGRMGGEEFAILFPETGRLQALETAERLRQAVANTEVQITQGKSVHFAVSIGVAFFAAADVNVDAILKRADAALYEAKNTGRNRVCSEA